MYQSEQAEQRDEHGALRVATPIKLTKEQLRTLSEVNPFISTCHILLEWTAVVLTAILCHHFWNPKCNGIPGVHHPRKRSDQKKTT